MIEYKQIGNRLAIIVDKASGQIDASKILSMAKKVSEITVHYMDPIYLNKGMEVSWNTPVKETIFEG